MKKYFVLFAVSFLPYVLLSPFVHPAADDFTVANAVAQNGFWKTQSDIYLNWFGRYFSTLIRSLHPLAIRSFFLYQVYPMVILLLLAGGIYSFTKSLFPDFRRNEKLFITLGVLSLFISRMPSVVEGFYWLPGYIDYTIALPIVLVAGGFLLRHYGYRISSPNLNLSGDGLGAMSSETVTKPSASGFSLVQWGLLLLACFAICGINEIIMLLWIALLVLLGAHQKLSQKKIPKALFVLVGVSLVCGAVVALSPGNRMRAALFPGSFSLWTASYKSLGFGIWHFFRFLGPASITALGLILLWVLRHRQRLNPNLALPLNRKFLWLTLALLLFGSLFPAFYGMDGRPPRRALNMICLGHNILMALLFMSYLIAPGVRLQKFVSWFSQNRFLGSEKNLFIVLALSLVLIGNHRKAVTDLTLKAAKYDQALKERYSSFENQKDQDVSVRALVNPPRTICFDDITEDPTDWRNLSYAAFWGLKSVKKYGSEEEE